MQKLWDFLTNFWDTITTVFNLVLDGILYILLFVFKVALDGLLTLVYLVISTLDVGSFVFNAAAAWTGLDTRIVWLVNSMGLPTCMTILGGAYVIRFLINLIPAEFTRV